MFSLAPMRTWKVRSLSDHPWIFDSDKTGQSRSARRKGANENCIPLGTLTFTIFDAEAEQNEYPLRS